MPATACAPPQALRPVGVALRMRACVLASLPLHNQAYIRCSGLAKPSASALQCLDVLSGAVELPRRLAFSCVCAGPVPVAPAVGAVLAYLRLAYWWHAVWCDVCGIFASCMYSALIGGLLPCTLCSVVGLRWWAGVSRVCVPSMVSCSSFELLIHAQPLRLFVTH